MSASDDSLALDPTLAPPMENGELVFAEPWQARVFGMARRLCEQGCYEWDEFRCKLIERVENWDENAAEQQRYPYYDLFLAALESLLLDKSLLEQGQLVERFQEYQARPHGHDH